MEIIHRKHLSFKGRPNAGYRNQHKLPARQNCIWNEYEENMLFSCWAQGLRIWQFAQIVQRRESAVKQHLSRVLERRGVLKYHYRGRET